MRVSKYRLAAIATLAGALMVGLSWAPSPHQVTQATPAQHIAASVAPQTKDSQAQDSLTTLQDAPTRNALGAAVTNISPL